jgi:hypothetical protein
MDILEVLVLKGTIDKKQAKAVREESSTSGLTVEEVLIKKGITPQEILAAKGEYFDIPVRNINGTTIAKKTLDYIPEETSRKYNLIPTTSFPNSNQSNLRFREQ